MNHHNSFYLYAWLDRRTFQRSRLNVAEMAAVEFVSAAVDDDQVGFRTGLLSFAEAEPALFPHVAEPQVMNIRFV